MGGGALGTRIGLRSMFLAAGWLAALWSGACAPAAPTEPPTWSGDFAAGSHPVGFRTLEAARVGSDGSERRLVISIWYPADPGMGTDAVSVGDYLDLVMDEGQLTETQDLPLAEALVAAMTGGPTNLAPDLARRALTTAGAALRDAPSASGPWPLILWSSRHATPLAQAPMSEALASRGNVVVNVWSSDPPLAFIWEDHPESEKLATITGHTADLQRAIEVVAAEPWVDDGAIVVLAWSYGGQTAARLQELDDRVTGVVSFDANVLPARAEESLDLRRPLVVFMGSDTARRGVDRLGALTQPWVALRLPDLAHGNFNAMESYLPALFGTDAVYPWSLGGEVGLAGYPALTRMAAEAVEAFGQAPRPAMLDLQNALVSAAGIPVELLGASDSW